MADPYRILIIGPSWVGDMMMAQSLFILLKSLRPGCQIDVLAPDWSLPLLKHMPEVSDAISSPFKHGQAGLKRRFQLGKSLRSKHYNQTIILPNSFKSALTAFWARIPLRTGFIGELRYGVLNDARKLDKEALPRTVMRFASLALPSRASIPKDLPDPLPLPHLHTHNDEVSASLQALKLSVDTRPILALCPGAEYGPAKQWPAEHLATLANTRIKSGWQVWLLGSQKDFKICEAVNALCSGLAVNLAGKTELGQVIDLMSCASAIVSNDSGLMHIAAALNVPLVAIYGSSDPGFTPPLTNKVEIQSLQLDCSPCFKRDCPLGHLDCLNKLEPDSVNSAIDRLLAPQND